MKSDQIIERVSQYYTEKIEQHGATPQGVDWNDELSQHLRFKQIEKLFEDQSDYSLIDWGCGYGALLDYLRNKNVACKYIGLDCSASMVAHARELHANDPSASFVVGSHPETKADYVITSGIFNVKGDTVSRADWRRYVLETIDAMAGCATKGFALNILTSYSDADKMRDSLFYEDPCFLFDHCKKKYSRNVALLHDYGLYEFTILVRYV